MVNIKDVALLAGVSDKTVSRVANGEPNVHVDTARKVEEAIARLGYVPNMAARHMRSSRSSTFGIVTDFIATTPYSGDIVRGIHDWARANRRTVLLGNTNGDPEQERQIWRTFREHRIEGVLYVTMYHREIDPTTGGGGLPAVLVNCHPATKGTFCSIEPDDAGGSRALTAHLIGLGHRRIGYVRLNPRLLGAELRHEAFLATTREAGLAACDLDVRLGMDGPIGSEANYVHREVQALLASPDRPTAILCGNDEMALQAYLAALSLGLRVPEDISIAGFDDFRTVSLALKPQLTTAALPYYDLGFQGATLLERVLGQGANEVTHALLACDLVLRGSVIGPS